MKQIQDQDGRKHQEDDETIRIRQVLRQLGRIHSYNQCSHREEPDRNDPVLAQAAQYSARYRSHRLTFSRKRLLWARSRPRPAGC